MSTLLCPRPLHPFPHLIAQACVPAARENTGHGHLSHAQRKVLSQLTEGARVLFDMQAKRALIYGRGLRQLAELTVRALAELVRAGWLVVTGREGRLVHYALARRLASTG